MTKGLKDYCLDIQEVFEEFLEHLPSSVFVSNQNYTNTYFLSLLIQNSIWTRIDDFFDREKASAFQAIKEEAAKKR